MAAGEVAEEEEDGQAVPPPPHPLACRQTLRSKVQIQMQLCHV